MTTILTRGEVTSDNTSVREVKVVVHTSQVLSPTFSENHWSIYLILGGNSSIRINMRAEYDDPTGILEWTRCSYVKSTSELKSWSYPASAGIKVKDFAGKTYEWKRDQYEMSGGGSGCRFWA